MSIIKVIDNVEYYSIKGFDMYLINKNGGVYSLYYKKILTPLDNGTGYYRYDLKQNKLRKMKCRHRLIAETFIDNPNSYTEVDHINRNKGDDRIENLRWCSRSINQKNKNIFSNNTSGIKGVKFDKFNNRWIAMWNIDGKQKNKSFSCKKHLNAKELAIEYRNKMNIQTI